MLSSSLEDGLRGFEDGRARSFGDLNLGFYGG